MERNKISKFRKEQSKLQEFLFRRIGLIAHAYVTQFIQHQIKEILDSTKAVHQRKLRNLGLNSNLVSGNAFTDSNEELSNVRNLSKRRLSETEYKLLNRELKFGIFPSKFNYTNIQTEFEDLYQ